MESLGLRICKYLNAMFVKWFSKVVVPIYAAMYEDTRASLVVYFFSPLVV